jgi:hypothetical protein
MALGVYEMGDSEVFDDLPQWDEEPQRQFDEMLNSGVVWDEEFEHSPMHDNVFDEVFSEAVLDEGGQDMPDQHGLLKKLTIDADAWVGKHKMYAEQELLDDRLIDLLKSQEVIWDVELVHELQIGEQEQRVAHVEKVTFRESLSEQIDHQVLHVVPSQASVMWDLAVQEEFTIPYSVAVLWDEIPTNNELHDDWLLQLAYGGMGVTLIGEGLDVEKEVLDKLSVEDLGAAQMPSKHSVIKDDALHVDFGELTIERNTPLLIGVVMDHVNGMPVNVNLHDGSLLKLSDQTFKLVLLVGAYISCVKNKRPCLSIRQWDPGIFGYLAVGLAYKMAHISTSLQLSQCPLEMFRLQLVHHSGQWARLMYHGGPFEQSHGRPSSVLACQYMVRIDHYSGVTKGGEQSWYLVPHFHKVLQGCLYNKIRTQVTDGFQYRSRCHAVQRQWDPSIGTTTAWGQAVFRGASNVTTQMRPKMEPKLSVQLLSTTQPNPTKVAAPIQGSASNTGKDRTEIRKQIRVDPFSLRRAPQRAIPASCRLFLLTATPCTLFTSRRWLPGGQGRYS